MRVRAFFLTAIVLCGFPSPGKTADYLTGDTRLACEAILCLSSPHRPGACGNALDRYFGIKKKKWSQTVSARKSFLNKCPSASVDPTMVSLANSITEAAGQCGANELNTHGQWIEIVEIVRASSCNQREESSKWHTITYVPMAANEDSGSITHCEKRTRYWQVNRTPPDYCQRYWDHAYTYYEERPQIVTGQNPWDTRWE